MSGGSLSRETASPAASRHLNEQHGLKVEVNLELE